MPVAAICPKCGKRYRVKDGLRGKTVACNNCKNRFSIGAKDVGESEFFDSTDDVMPEKSLVKHPITCQAPNRRQHIEIDVDNKIVTFVKCHHTLVSFFKGYRLDPKIHVAFSDIQKVILGVQLSENERITGCTMTIKTMRGTSSFSGDWDNWHDAERTLREFAEGFESCRLVDHRRVSVTRVLILLILIPAAAGLVTYGVWLLAGWL